MGELERMLKPKSESPRKRATHFIQIGQGEDPEQAEADYRREHDVSKRDVLFILNMSGVELPGSEKPKAKKKIMEDDPYWDDPVIQDLGEAKKKPPPLLELREEESPPVEKTIPPRPPRLRGLSWAEIRILAEDGELTREEMRWLAGKSLPGSWMPILKNFI